MKHVLLFSLFTIFVRSLRPIFLLGDMTNGKYRKKDGCTESVNMRTEASILNVSEIINIMPAKQFHFNVNTL
jgi:hypothetical protein